MIGIVTFGDNRLKPSLKRFQAQAWSIGVFDRVSINSEADLPLWYRQQHAQRLVRGSRGFGYYCWKPQIVLQTLENMPDLEMLFWIDVGCHVRIEGRDRLCDYIEALKGSSHDVLAFQLSIDGFYFDYDGRKIADLTEAHRTKGDLFHHFEVDEHHAHAQSAQFASGVFAVKNNSSVKDMLRAWVRKTAAAPFLFNDEKSVKPNFSGFREHRHDQSYFSLWVKKTGAVRFSAFEFWYPEHAEEGSDGFDCSPDWETIDRSPFFAMRDKQASVFYRGLEAVTRLPGRFQTGMNKVLGQNIR